MSDRTYEHDALAWAEHQAALLRRHAAGERVNEIIDWQNVIEEVQDVGLSELRACRSFLRQAMVHLLKLQAWPSSAAATHWTSETVGFLAEARDHFAPSMRQRINCPELYEVALAQVQAATDDTGPARPLRTQCPYELDDLLTRRPNITILAAAAGSPADPS